MCATPELTLPLQVVCPDGTPARVLSLVTAPPESYGHDGYPLPPTDEWLRVRHADGAVRYWPAGLCVPAGEG